MPQPLLIGIDVGGTFIKAGCLSQNGQLLRFVRLSTGTNEKPSRVLPTLISTIQQISESVKGQKLRIGVGMPGVLDRKNGSLIQAPNLPAWNGFPLQKSLEKGLGSRVQLENDANCAALGEMWMGAAKKQKNFLMITLGTGVGSGLLLDRKLWTGSGGMAGEFGHLCVEPQGESCGCAALGCLEVYSSAKGLVRRAQAKGLKVQNAEQVFALAKKSNSKAREIIQDAAHALAIGIGNVVQLLDIRYFVLGGGMSQSFSQLKPLILAELRSHIYGRGVQDIQIVQSKLGDLAGVYGAAYLAKD